MQNKTSDSVDRSRRLEYRIARLKRRAQHLEVLSNKYWVARRVIFLCGSLLALLLCKYSGTIGLILASLFLLVFVVVAVYHSRVRDSLTRNALMLAIKEVQVARINLDWDHLPHSDQAS